MRSCLSTSCDGRPTPAAAARSVSMHGGATLLIGAPVFSSAVAPDLRGGGGERCEGEMGEMGEGEGEEDSEIGEGERSWRRRGGGEGIGGE